MKIKTLLCNCKGLSPSFRHTDMNTLPFDIESDFDVQYAAAHPQLCGHGGKALLEDVLRAAEDEPDTYVLVCGCSAEAQTKLFKKVLRATGFPADHFISLDIQNATKDGILDRIRAKIVSLTTPEKPH